METDPNRQVSWLQSSECGEQEPQSRIRRAWGTVLGSMDTNGWSEKVTWEGRGPRQERAWRVRRTQ